MNRCEECKLEAETVGVAEGRIVKQSCYAAYKKGKSVGIQLTDEESAALRKSLGL